MEEGISLASNPVLDKMEFQALLRMARDYYTLRKLSGILGVDIPTLSKYSNYQLIPSLKRVRILKPKLLDLINPVEEVRRGLLGGTGVPDLNNIIGHRPHLLHYVAIQFARELLDERLDKIMSIEGGGLALASMTAMLTGKGLVYGVRNAFFEEGITEYYRVIGGGVHPEDEILYINTLQVNRGG